MIKIHINNPSGFMLEQYQAKKEKLLSYLIEELTDAKVRSPYSFRLIMLALNKFYPDIQNKPVKLNLKKQDNINLDDLKELERALAV